MQYQDSSDIPGNPLMPIILELHTGKNKDLIY